MPVPVVVTTIVGWMIESRLEAAQAASRAAEEFDYFLKLSESELTELSFALSRAFPTYKYWQWFSILKNLRNYGMTTKPNGNGNGVTVPNGNADDSSKALLYGVIGAIVLGIIYWGGKNK